MTAKVILNPYAGRWLARRKWAEAAQALEAAGVDFEMVESQHPRQATQLAKEAVQEGFHPIIAAGGDGSISEVVNGIAAARDGTREWPALGILPLGTANDLVHNLKLPQDLLAAAQVIAAGQTRNIDLGRVNGRYFGNNAAIGLEPHITLKQQRIHRIQGTLRYLLATLQGVMDNPSWHMQLEWEGGSYEGRVTLVTVGNNPRTGGLFYVTPHADPFDGLLTFVYGYLSGRIQILKQLPRTMKPAEGNYVEHPEIHEVHSPWLQVRVEPDTPSHADGEIHAEAVRELTYEIVPGALPVLMGPG